MDQGERKKGLVDRANSAIDTYRNARGAFSAAQKGLKAVRAAQAVGTAAATSEVWIPAVIIGVIVLIVIFTVIILMGSGGSAGNFGAGNNPTPPPGGGTGISISSCTFYRDGEPEVKMGNPEMAQFIESVSAKVGVPAAVVAGIMRVESGNRFQENDPAYFAADYDEHCSRDTQGNPIACGLMQFTPDTFTGTFNNNSSEMSAFFGKNQVRAVIDSRNNVFPNNYLRIYSIKDSIIATAFKIKKDKQSANGEGPWDRAAIDGIVSAYYGNCLKYPSCTNGPYDYGEDVWNSFSQCKVTPSTSALTMTCPLDPVGNSAYITCGTFNHPVNLCAHGRADFGYPACTSPPYAVCPYSEQLKNAFDVVSKGESGAGIPVYLPMINRSVVQWAFTKSEFLNSNWGYRQIYNTLFNGHSIDLELTHLNESLPILQSTTISSGTQVATTHSVAAHLHTGVIIDGTPVDPITDLFMCTGN
ncbi:MAG: hypothetical protein A3H50_00575 [Candidatus Levybacteria bacterium RIFCSPLOWO2_02_FULL_37_10]|nr:MAG: hypothetical protein A2860_02210 [Candidatus Levybacteria bacterium RIFCSPHIGHO2_01_FULL_37_33]OGH29725.1 MAG: hypothetical protein A3F30_00385 [Candidatus Levybacteria bacterium RIFCSPHIGHO2_12_FULL_37_12]OGH44177.1 MAG: hypothetical protein A3H50_00575 [Candidatus Levybacteria bacterium RIFCSPLOWO2_02_FULL_37_10]